MSMKKHYFNLFALALVASFGLVSCFESDLDESASQGFRIDIPVQSVSTKAVTDNGTSAVATFKTTENVYVYNQSVKAIDDGVLHPSADADEATFTGTLNKTYSEGNILKVLYNTNSAGVVDYSDQDGAIENVKDAGTGEVTISSVSGGVITTTTATMDNLQSIFRFTFTYKGSEISGIRFVRIFSSNGKLLSQYDVVKGTGTYGPVTISRSDDLADNYVYAGLRFDANGGDQIVFQVIDANGKVYSGSKNAPASGFAVGKFYKTTVAVSLYTFTVASGKKVCFSPGDLGVDGGVYSFTDPFATWGWGNSSASKRVWFDYHEVNYTNIASGHELYGIKWRIETWNSSYSSVTEYKYEWNNVIARTIDGGNVAAFYHVQIGSNKCLLLPPDEATESDLEGLTSGATITNYVKYLAKGFVLLMNTGYANVTSSYSWGFDQQGWYWLVRENNTSNRFYFSWSYSNTPAVSWFANQARMRVRYVHDVD